MGTSGPADPHPVFLGASYPFRGAGGAADALCYVVHTLKAENFRIISELAQRHISRTAFHAKAPKRFLKGKCKGYLSLCDLFRIRVCAQLFHFR